MVKDYNKAVEKAQEYIGERLGYCHKGDDILNKEDIIKIVSFFMPIIRVDEAGVVGYFPGHEE